MLGGVDGCKAVVDRFSVCALILREGEFGLRILSESWKREEGSRRSSCGLWVVSCTYVDAVHFVSVQSLS